MSLIAHESFFLINHFIIVIPFNRLLLAIVEKCICCTVALNIIGDPDNQNWDRSNTRKSCLFNLCQSPRIDQWHYQSEDSFFLACWSQIWFPQIKAQFDTLRIISQKTKFDHIVASLTPDYAQMVRDLILFPPTTIPYTALKAQLIPIEAPKALQLLRLGWQAHPTPPPNATAYGKEDQCCWQHFSPWIIFTASPSQYEDVVSFSWHCRNSWPLQTYQNTIIVKPPSCP